MISANVTRAPTSIVRTRSWPDYRYRYRAVKLADGRFDVRRDVVEQAEAGKFALVVPFRIALKDPSAVAPTRKEQRRVESLGYNAILSGFTLLTGEVTEFVVPSEYEPTKVWLDQDAIVFGIFSDESRSPKRTLYNEGLDALAAGVCRERDCRPSFLGYHGFPATICASPNSAIVHGIPDGYTLRNGDVISIDAGAIYEGWHGDAAFTMTVGDVPDEVKELLEVTEQALWNGLRLARHGNRLGDPLFGDGDRLGEHGNRANRFRNGK